MLCVSPRAVHAWTFTGTTPSLFPVYPRGRKKKRFGKHEGGRKSDDGRARGSRRDWDRFDEESACCSEALYPTVERELGVQCYDGHQADRSQPLSTSSVAVRTPVRVDPRRSASRLPVRLSSELARLA